MADSERNSCTTTVGATEPAASRVRDMADLRGMRQYRVLDLLLAGWDMLTEDQQQDAHRRLFAKASRRTRQTA